MKIIEDMPVVFYENLDDPEPLAPDQGTLAIEMMILADFILHQLSMPMVRWMGGGMEVIRCFQGCTLSILNALLQAKLVNQSFYAKHRYLFDGEELRKDIALEPIEVYNLLYDVYYETHKYQVIMGFKQAHMLPEPPEDDPYYGNPDIFTPGQ